MTPSSMIADGDLKGRSGRQSHSFFIHAVSEQFRIWYALILHDIKSRYFGTGLGYVVTILWPLVHMIVILTLNAGRLAPQGSSMVLYAATAVIPYIACNYIGRFMTMGVLMNRSFMQYPIIKPLDLMIARALLEIVSNYIIVIIILAGMALINIDVVPANIKDAVLAWGASIFLGVSVGIFNGTIALAFPLWHVVFILFIILAWITCGLAIDPEVLPESISYYFTFNPVMHAVEWMRQAYYPEYTPHLLSKSYLIYFSLVCLCLGLVTERLARSFLLQQR